MKETNIKKKKCYIYTRVSTSMQVDGYSLDAQKERLKKYADYQNMIVVGEYSDEGKSGKSINGRPDFLRMLKDIEVGKDAVEFVLVFKLSRFGRNAADVLSSLQQMQDFGVNLICTEDGIDSSKDSGKLMISVLSAVAEIERENILVQTMEGRKQKAREGKWNGGFAPYGYKLVDGNLLIDEEEAETVRMLFDMYLHTNMGVGKIAATLNLSGQKKKQRQNGTLETFTAEFIKKIIDNPVYYGKIAYGRRKSERVNGRRNEYHVVKQESYPIYDGVHEAIISEEDWLAAQEKRKANSKKREKIHSLDHEHILTGIIKCPICGAGMYGNVNRKKKKDGTLYKEYFYYACKHRLGMAGHICTYKKQWSEEKVNAAVVEVIRQMVQSPTFEKAVREKIGAQLDTSKLDGELEALKKQLRQLCAAKDRLAAQMDGLDVSDRHYERKYQDMERRMDKFYDDIEAVESQISETNDRLYTIRRNKISEENIYKLLLQFDQIYELMTDSEKKELMGSFLESVKIYEEEQPNGKFLKEVVFNFPLMYDNQEIQGISWDYKDTVECVCLLSNRKQDEKMMLDAGRGKCYNGPLLPVS